MKGAYLDDKYQHECTEYIHPPPWFDESFKHPDTAGELIGNLCATRPAAFVHSKGLFKPHINHRYTALKSDPNLIIRHSDSGLVMTAVTTDAFLAAVSNQWLPDELFIVFSSKYDLKRLGKPRKHTGWNFIYTQHGILLHHNHLIE